MVGTQGLQPETGSSTPGSEPAGDDGVIPPVSAACPFPIVGIGASAGGLDAVRRLLGALPVDTGMAFVLIQHLHPDYPSQLAQILSRATAMAVVEVKDEPEVLPNHVYVIPPARCMVLKDGHLGLYPRDRARNLHRPVDVFFESLADVHGNCAIGVILSGTGSDGTVGMQDIKSEGGVTFAQDDSAQHGGMPDSAITAGCVDFVCAPEEIASRLAQIGAHPHAGDRAEQRLASDDGAIAAILERVREAKGSDFSGYKSTTLLRRLGRRFMLRGLDSPAQYLHLLDSDPAEVEALYRDFLINVTRFFRDPQAFDALATLAFPSLFQRASPGVRVWALGCATGEEAYSLAIGLHEYATREKLAAPIQVFATDLSERAIELARAGKYPREIEHQVSPERLERYFEKTERGYRIGKLIREMCVFAQHNVVSDPPFSRMDLISCRNLLIYMEPVLQQRLLPMLRYALNPGGFLWLGSAETIGSFETLFEVLDPRHRIYRAAGATGGAPQAGSLPPSAALPGARSLPASARARDHAPMLEPQRESDRLLLSRYVPASVLVDADGEILQLRGDTAPFLAIGTGKPSLNLFKLARDGLLVVLHQAIDKARRSGLPVSVPASIPDAADVPQALTVDVVPVADSSTPHFLVVFQPAPLRATGAPPAAGQADDHADSHRQERMRLVDELQGTRDYLQALLEQRDRSNEELQSANEESQSANEELQSINEELQTTKEEMESANEELLTLNDELIARHADLAKANDDLTNAVASTSMALVTIGPDLRIRNFTPAAQSLLRFISSDVGRPLGDIKLPPGMEDVESCLLEAMRGAEVPDRDILDRFGRWQSLRVRPYRTNQGTIDGAVMVLVDVQEQKLVEASLRDATRKFTLLTEGSEGIAFLLLDTAGALADWNSGAERLFGYSGAETAGKPLTLLFDDPPPESLAAKLRTAIEQGSVVEEVALRRRDGAVFWASGVLTALRDETGRLQGFSKVFSDVSEKHRSELERKAAEKRKDEFLSILAHELRNPLAPIRSSLYLLDNPALQPDDARKAREVMKRQVGLLVRLIDDLLDVARISRGRIEYRPEPLDLSNVIETAAQSVRPLIDAAGQKLTIEMPADPVLLYADASRLAQAVCNLLINANRYTPDGGNIGIVVGATPGECRITVLDDGIGIVPEAHEAVFELFAQAGRIPGRARDGLGIGLPIVRALVALHGGHVRVSSGGTDTGSAFTIVLPRGAAPEAAVAVGEATSLPTVQRVLIVDDNRDAADMLAAMLRDKAGEVFVAYDGERALEIASSQALDLALLDLGLPGMDGHELGRRIRQGQHGEDVAIVALTGWGQAQDRAASAQAGFDAHLTKPVDPQVLAAELVRVLRKRKGRAS